MQQLAVPQLVNSTLTSYHVVKRVVLSNMVTYYQQNVIATSKAEAIKLSVESNFEFDSKYENTEHEQNKVYAEEYSYGIYDDVPVGTLEWKDGRIGHLTKYGILMGENN